MKNLNESLLESIDLIQESTIESELNVLFAMGEEYAKAAMITEYADASVVNEFDIIQESAIFMEADEDKSAEGEDKKEAKGDKKGNPIVRFLRWLKTIVNKFFEKAIAKFKNLSDNVKKLFAKKEFTIDGETFDKKDLTKLEKLFNETLDSHMKSGLKADEGRTSNEVKKNFAAIKTIYGSIKKKVFKFEGEKLMILVPFFAEGFEKAFAPIAKKNNENKFSFDMKKLADFKYVDIENAETSAKEDNAKISSYIDKLIAEASGNNTNADYTHLQVQASGFQEYALKTTLAYIALLSETIKYVSSPNEYKLSAE